MSSVLAKTFKVAEKSLRDANKACDKAETESRMQFLLVLHQRLTLDKALSIPWKIRKYMFDYVFKSGTVTEKEKEEVKQDE